MGVFQRVRDAVTNRTRSSKAYQESSGQLFVNSMCSAYENVFAQARPLADEMESIVPYGIGRNGAPLKINRTPELAALLEPNEEMSYIDFMDTVIISWLTLSEVNIHVHTNRRGRVLGYSILPAGSRTGTYTENGESIFQFSDAHGEFVTLTSAEVMTLRFSRNPMNVMKGVSPASSVFTYSQIDDLMAQYQKAYLENGAVPAYITIIRASTKEKFEEKKRELEYGLKGAKNRNKTAYVWQQYLANGDEKSDIEVRTIQGNNSTLDIKGIIGIVDNRLNKAFGVSEFILGNDSSTKYDNGEMSDLLFTKRRVIPAMRRFWAQFQHELDRITGGLGYAISYDIDIPELTDRKKTLAETAKLNSENLTNLIKAGSMPSAAIKALDLPDSWKSTADGIYARVLSDQTSNINSQASARENKNVILNLTAGNSDSTYHNLANLPFNSDLKSERTTDDYTPVFGESEQDAKLIYDQLMKVAREIAAQNPEVPVAEVEKVILGALVQDANKGANDGARRLRGLAYGNSVTEADVEALRGEINETLAGDGFQVSDEYVQNLSDRVNTLVESYKQDTEGIIAETLNIAQEEGLTQAQITRRLAEVLPRYRAEMIARNETVNAYRVGRLGNDEYLANKYNLKIKKVWRANPGACPLCEAMDGETVQLREAFPAEKVVVSEDGEPETLVFGHSHWNMNGETPDAHVNCRCYFDEEVDYDQD